MFTVVFHPCSFLCFLPEQNKWSAKFCALKHLLDASSLSYIIDIHRMPYIYIILHAAWICMVQSIAKVQLSSSELQRFGFHVWESEDEYVQVEQVKLPRSPWRDASSAPFGQFLHTSNEKHRKGLPRLSVFQLSASKCKALPFGVRVRCMQIPSDHCWSGSDIHTYICDHMCLLFLLFHPKGAILSHVFRCFFNLHGRRCHMTHDVSMACNTWKPAKLKDECGDMCTWLYMTIIQYTITVKV